jgi:hypothetical protein
MGFDVSRIPLVHEALGGALLATGHLERVERVLDGPPWSRRFTPPRSWPSLSADEPRVA